MKTAQTNKKRMNKQTQKLTQKHKYYKQNKMVNTK